MEDNILQGETVLTETLEFQWLKDILIEDDKNIESIDIGEDITLNLNRRISFYKYFINYLLIRNYKSFDIERRHARKVAKEVYESIENGTDSPMVEKLADFIVEKFRYRGLSADANNDGVYGSLEVNPSDREIWTKADIIADLKADIISREKMIVYAFGLGMGLEELEIFLMNVLEETGLNIWDMYEGLIYIALKQFPDDSINFYIRAKELYDDPICNNQDSNVEKISNLNTINLQNYINEYLDTFDDVKKVDDEVIIDIVIYHKELVSQNTSRTIQAEFIKAFKDIEQRLALDIVSYEDNSYGSLNFYSDDPEFFATGTVKIDYEGDLLLDSDTIFTWQSEKTKEKICYHPDRVYSLLAADSTAEITLISDSYTDKDDVPVLYKDDRDYKYIGEIEGVKNVCHGNIFMTERRIASLLSYLYNEEALICEENAKLNEDQMEVLSDILANSKIESQNIYEIIENGNLCEISRGRLVSLFFIDYYLRNEERWFDNLQSKAKRKRDYLVFMDHKLRNCRLYEYNISNPYEDVLLKLVVYDEPIEAFRDMWAKYLINK